MREIDGIKLGVLMRQKKIKLTELAQVCGVSRWAISHYISGKLRPSQKTLDKICQALGTREGEILKTGENRKFSAVKLRIVMDAQGLSHSALARKVPISRQAISLWCKGKHSPGPINLAILCEALGVHEEDLTTEVK